MLQLNVPIAVRCRGQYNEIISIALIHIEIHICVSIHESIQWFLQHGAPFFPTK